MSEFIKVSRKLGVRINAKAKLLGISPAQCIKNALDDQDDDDSWNDTNAGFTNEGLNGPQSGDGFGPAPACCSHPCNELIRHGVRFIKICARYTTPCPHCAGKIYAGTEVFWSPGYAAYHVGCLPRCTTSPVSLSYIYDRPYRRCGWRY